MTWIETIPPNKADGKLADLYRRIAGSSGEVDNILQAHSLRPHTLQGHMALYKSVLHHSKNKVPRETLELLGVWVSWLNGCDYCVDHHFAGLCKLLGNADVGRRMKEALVRRKWRFEFSDSVRAMLSYAESLTSNPKKFPRYTLNELRGAGVSDGEILEVNQVVAYFNYANRTVLGLGVNHDGDVLGSSPNNSGDENDWQHRPADEPTGPKVSKHNMRGSVSAKPGYKPVLTTIHGRAFGAGNNIRTGSAWFDIFFRLSAGLAIGCGIGMWLYLGGGTTVVIENKWPSHPLTNGVALGFITSVPANILYFLWRSARSAAAKKAKKEVPPVPRFIGRPAIGVGIVLTFVGLWFIDSTFY
ncbi:MAG: peroxidase-related enzyme [Planctomycetes bacterium]|nr:peroxidase-related enzyme [Planctomycetota bacterium]